MPVTPIKTKPSAIDAGTARRTAEDPKAFKKTLPFAAAFTGARSRKRSL
jgi:hypothetical protein